MTVVALAVQPAGAAGARHQRDRTQQHRGQVQEQLNLAQASDANVEAEAVRLAGETQRMTSEVAAAQSASAAAIQTLSEASARLADATARNEVIRKALVDRVVEAYSHPFREGALILSGSVTLDDLARRQELLKAAVGRDSDALDAFRQRRRQLTDATQAMSIAKKLAAERAQAAAARVVNLTKAQADAQAAHIELTRRIADLSKESADLAAQEGGIEALIRAQDAQAQAALAQQAAQRASADPAPKAPTRKDSGGAPAQRRPVPGTGLIWPIHGPITSEYGPRWGGFHPGIDIAPP